MALADNALTRITTVEEELGLTPSAQNDLLTRYINAASAFIETYCNRKFYYEVDIEEDQPGYGTKYMHVDRSPIVSISSIAYDGTDLSSDDYEIYNAESGGIYALGNWTWTTNYTNSILREPIPGNERKLYTVTYTGGWITPEQAAQAVGTRNLPYDLEDACIMLITERYRKKGRDPTVKSETLLEGSQTFAATSATTGTDPLQASNPGVWSILQRYKRHPIGG